MSKIKTVLFDLDGTLRDSTEAIYGALEETLVKHIGKSPSREEMFAYMHHHTKVREAFAQDVDPDEFEVTYEEALAARRPTIILYRGVEELLHSLHSAGFRLGIVSSGTTATAFLERNGLRDYFEVIVDASMVKTLKPDPESVDLILDMMHVQPAVAVMIGDMVTDIEAAHRAGVMKTIGVTHGFSKRETLEKAGADFVVDSLAELPAAIEKLG